MPQLLLELFSEEIPARMQAQAARDLSRMAAERLGAQALAYDGLQTFVTPRRLTLVVDGLPAAQADRTEELKGPRASAPPQALEGFLRKTGLAREALTERGGVLYATLSRPGRPTPEIAAEAVAAICAEFPWPKSMRSGVSAFRWVRPLRSVILLFDGDVVPVEIGGVASGRITRGHRFLGSLKGDAFEVSGFDDYRAKLERQGVTLDAAERRAAIASGAQAACDAEGLEPVSDEGLLDEVTGLVEHPVPLLGAMDPAFLDLPPEVIRTSMRTHQKYFAVRDPATGRLAPRFVVVANIEARDGGEEIRRGNAKVLSARLNDARFFWDEDRKSGAFERWAEKLHGVTFHARLGTMAERVERIAALAAEIAPAVGADPKLAQIAARLAKLDLASAMVGEFPELQGVMGGYYAREAGAKGVGSAATAGELLRGAEPDGQEDPLSTIDLIAPQAAAGEGGAWWAGLSRDEVDQVADAVRDHYKPVGPSDSVPTAPVTVAVALADKLDTLVGFFAIDERPTGSKDPYALRRAALGVIRIALAARAKFALDELCATHGERFFDRQLRPGHYEGDEYAVESLPDELAHGVSLFIAERLEGLLKERGERHDLVQAAFWAGDGEVVGLVDRVEALSAFLATDDGANLLAGYKRAVNILRAEAKKHPDEAVAPLPVEGEGRGAPGAESDLLAALQQVRSEIGPRLEREDFTGAMASLSRLRAPVDAFFDGVLVNDPDPAVRLHRLRLLATLRDLAGRVADFSLIQG